MFFLHIPSGLYKRGRMQPKNAFLKSILMGVSKCWMDPDLLAFLHIKLLEGHRECGGGCAFWVKAFLSDLLIPPPPHPSLNGIVLSREREHSKMNSNRKKTL